MQRLRRLSQLWNWIPAFRAVAEVGGIRRAATLMSTSPSALSRSITLLEAEVGTPLFDRIGTKLQLTRAGEDLLTRVRAAMRGIDEALPQTDERRPILLLGATNRFVEPVLVGTAVAVATSEPEAVVECTLVGPEQAAESLLSGRVDLLVTTRAVDHQELEALGTCAVPMVAVVARADPLAPLAGEALMAQLAKATFVTSAADADLESDDGWSGPRRTARIAVGSVEAALQAAKAGLGVAVAPAFAIGQASDLAPLSLALVPRTLHMTRRRPVGDTPLLDAAVTHLRRSFAATS